MFKFEFKTTLIVALLAAFVLFSFAGYSDAIEIISMYPSDGGYEVWGGLYHTAYVETSEPYYVIDWYVNDVYVGYSSGDMKRQKPISAQIIPQTILEC